MTPSRRALWSCCILVGALAAMTACAPFGVEAPPPSYNSATASAAASATYAATSATGSGAPAATLAPLTVDPGWVAVAQVDNGSALGGPEVIGEPSGASTASAVLPVGSFTLSPAAKVVILFSCASPPNVHASLAVSVSDADTAQIQCNAIVGPERDEMTLEPSWAGRTLKVSATISTDSQPPQWNLLVEQPK